VTGWSLGDDAPTSDAVQESDDLYAKLEHAIAPLYYRDHGAYAQVMRTTLALNGAFFNAQRMVQQYLLDAYAVAEA
jgi:starch phosphorylase